jgi:HD-like signal output (HDOD) protein
MPLLPPAAVALLKLIQKPLTRVDPVARILQEDPDLAAGTVRVLNAWGASRGETVHSLRDLRGGPAAGRLARVGLGLALSPAYQVRGFEANAEAVWLEARLTAVIAGEIARRMGEQPAVAFACGLLLNSGKLLALRGVHGASIDSGARLSTPEVQRTLDEMGLAVRRQVLKQWRLPKVVEAAVEHQRKLDAPSLHREAVLIAHLAGLMARHGGRPSAAAVEKHPLVNDRRFHKPMLASLGGQFPQQRERALALALRPGRMRRRLAA